MLRGLRRADGPRLYELTGRYFPEEGALLRWRPGAFDAVLDRVFRPHVRFLLWLLETFRHPVVKMIAIEADGRLAGAAILTFPRGAGYISSVVVDEPYRRRGCATQIVRACEQGARRAGRRFTALDVLRSNAPAQRLYQKLGYRHLRSQSYYFRDFDGPGPREGPTDNALRPIDRRDGPALAKLATRLLPPSVVEVLPPRAQDFFVAPLVAMGLEAETEAWVIDRGRGPEGFVRATSTRSTESGNLTAPLIAPEVPDETGRALVRTASEWLLDRGTRRIVTEIPSYYAAGLAALAREGFREAIATETLYRPLAA